MVTTKQPIKEGGHILWDMDGTLAEYHGWNGEYDNGLGKPIPKSVALLKQQLASGYEVRIFTARAGQCEKDPKAKEAVEAWCLEHLGEVLPITNKKDFTTLCIFDDRAFQVVFNTGEIVGA